MDAVTDRSDVVERIIWSPGSNWAQWALLECPIFEVFFGGARGGGKTDGALGEFMVHADAYGQHASGLMVRRTYKELVDTIERSKAIYGPLKWTYNETEKLWRDPRGARLRFAYLDRDSDAEGYQGHSYTRVYIEEIGNFPSPAPVFKLFATLRSGAGVPVAFRATGNPGGPGHQWVKARYIDPAPLGNQVIHDPVTGLDRIFIPSKVDNNPFIDAESYKQRLRSSGSKELVQAWLDGDWSVTLGAFFDCWSTARHVVRPFEIPKEWMKFRAMDWGSAHPFCVQWWAVVSDDGIYGGKFLPRGCMVLYREWYGAIPGQPNVGIKMNADDVGKGISLREKDEEISYGVLDPSAFIQDGGPSIAERMGTGSGGKVWFRRADNKRVHKTGGWANGGWDVMRWRMEGNDDGHPMMAVFSTAVDFIRTVPFLQHDPDRPEDVLSDSEDHSGDCCFPAGTLVTLADGQIEIERVLLGDFVYTRLGPQPVEAVFSVGERPVFTVTMSDGTELTGTANHPIFVEGKGFTPLAGLRYGDMLRSCARQSHSRAASITAGQSIQTAIGGYISGPMRNRSIERSGRMLTGQFRHGMQCITSTAIRSTTRLRTWLSCLLRNMPRFIWPNGKRLLSPVSIAGRIFNQPVFAQGTGFAATLANPPFGGPLGPMTKSASVRAVAQHSRQTTTANNASAAMHVPSPEVTSDQSSRSNVQNAERVTSHGIGEQPFAALHVVSVQPAGKQKVFNLTVAVAEEYFANGILVHNCRYACMSRPWAKEKDKPKQEGVSGYAQIHPRGEQPGDWRTY